MARGYLVKGPDGALRIGGSVAHCRELRDEIIERVGCKKKDVEFDEEVEIPTRKEALLDFFNKILSDFDLIEEEDDAGHTAEEEE